MCEICFKLTIKTPGLDHNVISFSVSNADFEQINFCWDNSVYKNTYKNHSIKSNKASFIKEALQWNPIESLNYRLAKAYQEIG